jgi:hypothetical protein
MALIFSGRHAAQSEKAVVVSLIGMRGDKICTPGSWPRETAAMAAMTAELKPDLARGPLDARFFDDCYGIGVSQCWPGFDPVQVSAHRPWFGLAAERRPATGRLDAARSRIGRLKSAEDPTEQP